MTKEIKIWNYNDSEVRTTMINNEPWWVLTDVCKILELTTPSRVAERLDKDEVSQTHITDALGRQQNTYIINESGLYSVILRSDKPQAKPFRKWVTSEVLPSIRKTGKYELQQDNVTFSPELIEAIVQKLIPHIDQYALNVWKKHIAKPLIEKIGTYINLETKDCYVLVYDQMKYNFGFDQCSAIMQFCNKYSVDSVSVIDTIADNPIYQQWFTMSGNSIINNELIKNGNASIIVPTAENNSADKQKSLSISSNQFSVEDNYNDIVSAVAVVLNDTSKKMLTTLKYIYSKMNTSRGWKCVMSRNHKQTKKGLIETNLNQKKRFVKVCNEIIAEG